MAYPIMNNWIKQEIFRMENPSVIVKYVKKKEVKDTKQFSETKQLIKELGIAKMVSSITGRTKENHPGKAAQAEKKRKTSFGPTSCFNYDERKENFSKRNSILF